jgi:type II secretory pathway pseudopilin PulG
MNDRPKTLARHGAAGFTLLEVMVSTAFLVVMMVVLFSLLSASQSLEARNVAMGDLRAHARMALDRIVRELSDSGLSTFTVTPTADLALGSVTFQRATGYVGGAVVYGPQERIAWEIEPGEVDNNNIDDNGNGLIDEGQVVLTLAPGQPTEQRVIIATDVAKLAAGEIFNGADDNGNGLIDEGGLWFAVDPVTRLLSVGLTLQRVTRQGELLTASVQSQIVLRNP